MLPYIHDGSLEDESRTADNGDTKQASESRRDLPQLPPAQPRGSVRVYEW